MKVAINTRFLLPNKLEGIGWYTYHISKQLALQHPEVEFLFLFDRPFSEEFIFASNVKPLVLSPPARHPILWAAWLEWSVCRALKQHRVDAFFSPDGFLSLRSNVPAINVCHDLAYRHFPTHIPKSVLWYYDFYMPRFFKKAQAIAAVSEYSKQDLCKTYDIAPEKVSITYNACDEGFAPLSETEQQLIRNQYSHGQSYFLYVGSVHPRKNVERLLLAFDAFKQRSSSPVKLLLLGRMAWQTGEVANILNKMTHKNEVVFLGYQSSEVLQKLTASAFALTYVSLFEGFGIPIVEAMKSGTAVICSDVSSMPEVANGAALLVNPYEINSITEAMMQLWTNQTLREHNIQKGLQRAQDFSWETSAQTIWNMLNHLHKH